MDLYLWECINISQYRGCEFADFWRIRKKKTHGFVNLCVSSGSWRTQHAASRRPWRRRPRPSCPCRSQAACPGTARPRRRATPAATWPLLSRPPSPRPPRSAAARLQVRYGAEGRTGCSRWRRTEARKIVPLGSSHSDFWLRYRELVTPEECSSTDDSALVRKQSFAIHDDL